MDTVLGLDIGTSSCKAILLDENGKILASESAEYPIYSPVPTWYEQDPSDWWHALCACTKKLFAALSGTGARVTCIGLSAQMHGLVALDKDLRVLRRAILWNDQRTRRQCDEILEKAGSLKSLLGMINNNILTGYTVGKILWVRENEPDLYTKMRFALNPKDYIRLRMTGEIATEVSDASGTCLFDVRNRRWSSSMLDLLEIDRKILPPCFESTDITGYLTGTAAEQMGLPQGIPVCGGGGDAVIQTVGSGLLQEGVLATIIGTSGIVATGLEKFVQNEDGMLQNFCSNMPGLWHLMGVSLSAGGSFKWLKSVLASFGESNSFDRMNELATIAEPGSKKLLFLPHLSGERSPYNDPCSRGAFIGLTASHGAPEIIRSVMEGVILNLHMIYKQMPTEAMEIRTSGGGAASPLWRQIQADIFGIPVKRIYGAEEGGAFGAALIAGISNGIWKAGTSNVSQIIRTIDEVLPNKNNADIYAALSDIFSNVYAALAPINHALS